MKRISLAARLKIGQWRGLPKIIENVVWLGVDRVLSLITGLVVGAWVARYLGPDQLGVWAYAGAFVSLFAAVAGLGINNIVVRELASDASRKHELLGTAFFLRLSGSLLALVAAVLSIVLIRPDDDVMRVLVAVLSAGIVIQSFDVIVLWFQAQVESKYVVWSRRAAALVTAFVQVILILVEAPLVTFVWATLIESAVASLGFVIFYRQSSQSLRQWTVNWRVGITLLRASWPLIISGLALGIYMRIDKLMLGEMSGDEAVGVYEAAVRISELWYFVPMALASTVFPLIVRARQQKDAATYQALIQLFSDIMVGVSYLIVLPLVFVAQPLVTFLYGMDYQGSGEILVVHIWAMVFVSLGIAQSQWLIAEKLTHYSMWTTLLGALTNVLLNLWLIPLYGGIGAAWATVISYAVAGYIVCLFPARLRGIFVMFSYSILLPFRLPSVWRSFYGRFSSLGAEDVGRRQT